MKKKKLIIIISIITAILVAVGIVLIVVLSKSEPTPPHTHSYGEWVIVNEATCTSTGLSERKCIVCGNKETKVLDKIEHTSSYQADYVYHTETCSVCHTLLSKEEHTWNEDNVCIDCKFHLNPSENFTFNEIEVDGEQVYEITAIDSNVNDELLVFPAYNNNKKVVKINSNNLVEATNTNIKTIIVPNTITTISANTFSNFVGLQEITLPNQLETIEESTFRNCTNLTKINFPEKLTTIKSYAFFGSGLRTLELNEGLVTIENNAFCNCVSLNSVNFPESLTTIGDNAFSNCTNLNSILFTQNIQNIGKECFTNTSIFEIINLSDFDIKISNITDVGLGAQFTNDEERNKMMSIINENSESKIVTDEKGYRFYTVGEEVYLINYVGNESDITLPESFNGKDYIIYSNCFNDNKKISSVTIHGGITEIKTTAFIKCNNLKLLIISGKVGKINTLAFACSRLKNIVLNSQIDTIETRAFQQDMSVTDIKFYVDFVQEDKPTNWKSGWNGRNKIYYQDEWSYDDSNNPTPSAQ